MNGTFDITVIDTTHFSYTANGANGSNTDKAQVFDIPPATLIANLKSVAADAQAIFTRGNISYTCGHDYISTWASAGKGDIDILASNVYMGYGSSKTDLWKTEINILVNAFGASGTYLTEWGLNSTSLDAYSADEAVQAAGVAEILDYIKVSGMTRAIFHCYEDPYYMSGLVFGARKHDGTYRLIWNDLTRQFIMSGNYG